MRVSPAPMAETRSSLEFDKSSNFCPPPSREVLLRREQSMLPSDDEVGRLAIKQEHLEGGIDGNSVE